MKSTIQRLFTKEKHSYYRYFFLMRTINPELGLQLKIIQKDAFMLRSRICRFIWKLIKYIRCDMNDVTIPHAFVLRKTLCTTSSVSERGDIDSENHSVVIRSIYEIYSIKTENIDGYIIKHNSTTD